ncbi:MAG: class I tRNA ligase family protein, partial [Thermodesulfobacteriota bacterium]
EMTNELMKVTSDEADQAPDVAEAMMEALRTTAVLLSPFVPHVAEELWEALGGNPGMVRITWPAFDPEFLTEDEMLIVVQVNGKKRGEIRVPVDAAEDLVREKSLAEPNVQKFVEGKTLRKAVYVPGRIMNLVVG